MDSIKKPWYKRKRYVILIGFLLIVGIGSLGNKNTSTTQTIPTDKISVGDNGFLRLPSNPDPEQIICLGATKEDYEQINKAFYAKDYLGLLEIPGAFCVHNGAKILVVDRTTFSRRVRIMEVAKEVDKDKVGLAGWVQMEFVAKK